MKTTMTAAQRQANWGGMNWIRQEKRLAIYLRDGLACAYCGVGVEQGAVMHLDHVMPVERGGDNDAKNLVTSCERCNLAKGARTVAQFADSVAGYLNHGVTRHEIFMHVRACTKRSLPLATAKNLIAKRGSAARVLAHLRANGGQS